MSIHSETAKQSLSASEAIAGLTAGAVLVIDVREMAEVLASGTALGGVHIPLGMLPLKADPRAPDFDRRFDPAIPIAVFCAVGGRAGRAAEFLNKLGYQAHNIGGFDDWVAHGGAVTR